MHDWNQVKTMPSDISRTPFEGEAESERVVVSFEDGTKRELRVTVAEATAWKAAGTAEPSQLAHAWTVARPHLWKAFTVIVALYIASIIVPAITQQWADRAKDADLKSGLVSNISDSAAKSIGTARSVTEALLPETRARIRAYERLRYAEQKRKSKQAIEKLQSAYNATVDAEVKAVASEIETARSDWTRTGASVEAQLDAYFPDSGLAEEWHAYYLTVVNYLELGSTVCGDQRDEIAQHLEAYLEDKRPARWAPLRDASMCRVHRSSFVQSFHTVGEELLDRRGPIVQQIVTANSPAYSVGRRDLINQISFGVLG
jgi:hypothetical protein